MKKGVTRCYLLSKSYIVHLNSGISNKILTLTKPYKFAEVYLCAVIFELLNIHFLADEIYVV